MGEGSRGLGKNQQGLRVGCCEMVEDYYEDSSVEENLNLLLRLTRVEANVDSKMPKGQGSSSRDVSWGLPQQVLATVGCVRRFKGLHEERTLESSTKTQRDPGIQGE